MTQSAGHSVTGALAGFVLVVMAAFAPWALLRLLPLAELASGAAGPLRGEARGARRALENTDAGARWGEDRLGALAAGMARDAVQTSPGNLSRDGATAERERLAELAAVSGSGRGVASAGAAEAQDGDSGAPNRARGTEPGDGAGPDGRDDSSSGSVNGGEPKPGSSERIPGLDSVMQAEDWAWRPLTLGLEEEWPPAPLWPHGDAGEAPSDPHGSEDHDPRPPGQQPDEGRL
jgi:hypothetical protein